MSGGDGERRLIGYCKIEESNYGRNRRQHGFFRRLLVAHFVLMKERVYMFCARFANETRLLLSRRRRHRRRHRVLLPFAG